MKHRQIACRGLLVASRQTPILFDAVEEAFNLVTLSVELFVQLPRGFAIGLGRDHRERASGFDQRNDFIAVKGFVRNDRARLCPFE